MLVKDSLRICIPSRSRPNVMNTVYSIPKKYHDSTSVYVASEQLEEYNKGSVYAENPGITLKSVSTLSDLLGRKLELMAKDCPTKYVMLCDDDFTFFKRIKPDQPQLEFMTEKDWDNLLLGAITKLNVDENLYALGVSMRQGNNRLKPLGNFNNRLNGCIIYRKELFLDPRIIHDRVNPMNDFDVNLQLLRLGYDNLLLSQFCYNQAGMQTKGGSSDYRTEETQSQAAVRLSELHKGFVTLRQKQNKTGGLKERTEVTVMWKNARASAQGDKR
jgi:hypothetical protein